MKIMLNIFILIFFISTLQLYSGINSQSKIDSLKLKLPVANGDTNHVLLLSLLSYELEASNTRLGIKYGLEGIDLAKQIKYKRGEADCNLYVGRNYFAEKDFDKALLYYNKSLKLYKLIGDKKAISYNYEYFANLYSHQSNYPVLLEYLNRLLRINKELGNKTQTADQLNNIGLVNLFLSRYNVALESFTESYLLNSELKDTIAIGFNLVNTARVYKELNEFNKAVDNFNKGLIIFQEANDIYNISRIYFFIAEIYFLQNNYDLSLVYVDNALVEVPIDNISKKFQVREYAKSLILKSKLLYMKQNYIEAYEYSNKGLNFSEKILYKDGIALSYSTIGRLYLSFIQDSVLKRIPKEDSSITRDKTNNLNLSIKYLLKAEDIFSSIGELNERSVNLEYLSKAYKTKGDLESALKYYEKYINLKDSVFNKENIKNLGKLESDFQYKIKLANTEKDKISAQKKEALSKNQNTILLTIITSLLILFILLIWLYLQRKKNIKSLEEKNKLIETQRHDIELKKEQLMKMNIAKDKIFGTISHDLRNTIIGFVKGTEKLNNSLPKDTDTDIQIMNQSANRMNDLLESLLQYADQDFNQFKIESQKINLSIIIEETLNLYSQEISSKKLNFTTAVDSPIAHTNEAYAGIIIRNIIHNAIKFTPIGGIIEITSSLEDNYIILKIKDNGIGISPEDIEKVNNYQRPQIQNPIGEISKGTGFGLVTAKEFIEKINGNLFIESKLGRGTTVLLYFPSQNT